MNLPEINSYKDFEEHYQSSVWIDFSREICRRHGISYETLKQSAVCEHIIFFIDDSLVIKVFAPFRSCFEREKSGLEFAKGKTTLKIPEIAASGNLGGFDYLVMTQIPGELLTREMWLELPEENQIAILKQLAEGLRELHSHDAASFDFDWQEFVKTQSKLALQRQIEGNVNPKILEELPEYIAKNLKLLPENPRKVFLHGDVHFGNLRFLETKNGWRISGLFDFSDSICGFCEFDLLAVGVLMIQGQGNLQREFFRAYGYSDGDLDETLRKRLMLMTILYECSDLRRYALRLKPEAVDFSLDELEKGIWSFLE